jgi:hypothetical protein
MYPALCVYQACVQNDHKYVVENEETVRKYPHLMIHGACRGGHLKLVQYISQLTNTIISGNDCYWAGRSGNAELIELMIYTFGNHVINTLIYLGMHEGGHHKMFLKYTCSVCTQLVLGPDITACQHETYTEADLAAFLKESCVTYNLWSFLLRKHPSLLHHCDMPSLRWSVQQGLVTMPYLYKHRYHMTDKTIPKFLRVWIIWIEKRNLVRRTTALPLPMVDLVMGYITFVQSSHSFKYCSYPNYT